MPATVAFRSAKPVAGRAASRRAAVACNASSMVQKAQVTAAAVALSAGLVAPAFAGVSFSGINEGAKVANPVHVEFQVQGMTVKPASEGIVEGTGHFHVIIDGESPAEGEAIPFDATHKHYGKGQLADDLDLSPGKHTLTLQFANAAHLSYGPEYAKAVTVNVQ